MGNATAGNNQFNALSSMTRLAAVPAIQTVTTNGVYRLHALDTSLRTSGRFYAATVRKDYERDYGSSSAIVSPATRRCRTDFAQLVAMERQRRWS